MTNLLKIIRGPLLDHVRNFRTTTAVKQYWNYDWKPGPYPKTMEERAAAAKKYGLLPEDYEPYPDDGTGYGDYPKLPVVSENYKTYNSSYDMRHLKRNYGEPLHVDHDLYAEERYDPSTRQKLSYNKQFFLFLSSVFVVIGLFYLADQVPFIQPLMKKQFKGKDKVHYTFEPAD